MGIFGAIVEENIAICRSDSNDGDFRGEANQTLENAWCGKIQKCGTEFRFGGHAHLALTIVALARHFQNAGSCFVKEGDGGGQIALRLNSRIGGGGQADRRQEPFF